MSTDKERIQKNTDDIGYIQNAIEKDIKPDIKLIKKTLFLVLTMLLVLGADKLPQLLKLATAVLALGR